MNNLWDIVKAAAVPLGFFALCGGGVWFLWSVRDRQPGNTRYAVMIYGGIVGLMLIMLIGFFAFGVL